MGLKDRSKSINISIKDFPGEYLDSKPEEVSNFIEESHIVMIAVDTPYLMEENGKYNEEKMRSIMLSHSSRIMLNQLRISSYLLFLLNVSDISMMEKLKR